MRVDDVSLDPGVPEMTDLIGKLSSAPSADAVFRSFMAGFGKVRPVHYFIGIVPEESIIVGIEPDSGYSASSTNHTADLLIEDNTPYSADWAREFEGFQGSSTGLLDDPDGDGCPNLLEFLMDGDPLRADAGRFWIETRRLVDSRDGLEKPFAALILERRIDSAGVALVVESATRLDVPDWTPEGILLETIQLPHSARERVIHRSAEPIGNAARFFRLKASVP